MHIVIMGEKADHERALEMIGGTVAGTCVVGGKTQILKYLTQSTPDVLLIASHELAEDVSVINHVRTTLAKDGRVVSMCMLGISDILCFFARRMP